MEIDLIKARSPQAKGRVERLFGTAQDRWVKELRLAKAKTVAQANAVLEWLLPEHNRRFSVAPAGQRWHRALGSGHVLAAIPAVQERRVVNNDYTIRFQNRLYQLDKPIYPGGVRQGDHRAAPGWHDGDSFRPAATSTTMRFRCRTRLATAPSQGVAKGRGLVEPLPCPLA
ncbi:MAG: hypothetical protein U0793_00290 [Gemmataceae bacterium]